MSQEAGKISPPEPPVPGPVAPGPAPAPAPATQPDPTSPVSSAVAPVEVEYVIQPNTIIELVDLYVPPAPSEFRFPSFQQPEQAGPSSGAPGVRGRRRGRPPLGSRPSGIPARKPYKRRRKAESPPPLPPVPNYLAHVINPLENEIYPKVIVQPARLPWVIPKNLNEDPPAPPPPPPPPAAPQPLTEKSLGPVSGTTMSAAQLCQSLSLFGPDVTVTQVTSHGQTRFLAVLKESNGQQRQILFSASQLQSFLGSRPVSQMGPLPLSWQKPLPQLTPPPGIVRLRPGPTPRRGVPVQSVPPPVQPPRVIVEPPPNFRLPTMAALRASAQKQARQLSAGPSLGARVVARTLTGPPLPLRAAQVAAVAPPPPGAETEPKAKADQDQVAVAPPKEPPKVEPTPTPAPAPPAPPPRPPSPELPIPRMPSILTRKSQMRLLHQRAKRAAEKEAEEAKKRRMLQQTASESKEGKENEPLKW